MIDNYQSAGRVPNLLKVELEEKRKRLQKIADDMSASLIRLVTTVFCVCDENLSECWCY